MLKYIVLLAIFGASTAQLRSQPEVAVVQDTREINPDGSFRYLYELSDGTRAESSGFIKNPGAPEDQLIQSVQGSYGHYTPEGQYVQISYVADENGYQPQGDALPTSPPIPEEIQRSLDIIFRNAAQQTQAQALRQQPFRPQLPRRN